MIDRTMKTVDKLTNKQVAAYLFAQKEGYQ